ncbi:MAG TPA: LuxR C-terminal-related transcriptional regulator, partial [Acidimicrobiales bacterium]|nr:LuxR C-terminal-related transcriptional regulator [Acidimicrobiales bacterium]
RAELAACLAELRIEQGRLDEAAQVMAPYEDSIAVCVPLARVHLARGRADLAVAAARRGLRRLRGDTVRAAPMLAALVDAELRLGQLDAATATAVELDEVARRAESPAIRAMAAVARGRVCTATGDVDGALDSLEGAVGILADAGRPALAADAQFALAEARAARGDVAGAIDEARAAEAVFERLGARPASDRCRALLRVLGAPGRPRAREAAALVSGLTAREKDVLRLVQQGRTNAEIASELYISPKTAEHHVGRLLAKLGVRTRTEAAALATRLEVATTE